MAERDNFVWNRWTEVVTQKSSTKGMRGVQELAISAYSLPVTVDLRTRANLLDR